MVHGSTTKKFEKNTRRLSPNKDTARKNAVPNVVPQKSNTIMPRRAGTIPREEDELLTPEFLLSSYATNKKSPNTSSSLEDLTKETPTISILELLFKRDNLEKLANSVSKAKEDNSVVPIPVKPLTNPSSPPATPKKPTNNIERFAGLPNSPAPSSLPLPSFHFFDQELNKRSTKDDDIPTRPEIQKANSNSADNKPQKDNKKTKQRKPSPPTRQHSIHATPVTIPVAKPIPIPTGKHSPPSNPHLDSMTNQLRMMLNIVPAQS